MQAELRYIVVRDLGSDSLVGVFKALDRDFEARFGELADEYAFPTFDLSVISPYQNPRELFGEERGLEVIARIDREDFASSDTLGLQADVGPVLAPKYRQDIRVESEKMNDDFSIECVTRFSPDLFIKTGELNCRVYTRRFYDLLDSQIQRFARLYFPLDLPFRTQVVCGPIVMIREEFADDRMSGTILPLLFSNQQIDLYCSRRRLDDHFRLADGGVYFEKDHSPNARIRYGGLAFYDDQILEKYRQKRDSVLADKSVYLARELATDFILLTESELRILVESIEKKDRPFNEYDREELRQIIQEELKINP